MADVNISKYSTQIVRQGSKPAAPGFVVSEGQDPVNPPGTNNYVPYSGATANVELGEYGLESGFVTLDTTPTGTPVDQGTIYWDDSKSTAALIMNGTTQHIGQDTYFYVKNSTGSNIAKGVAVRFDGTDGASGHLLIAPFLADGTYPSAYFMGVTAEAIDNGDFGQVTNFGEIEGIDTSIYSAGDLLYASTTSAGAFQTTAPVAPNNIVLIAAAVNSKNNGAIIVRPTYGSNINDDEGVKITTPTTGDLLQLQAGGLWENKTKAQILGGTSSQFVKGDGSLDSTSYQPLLTNPVTGTGTTNYLPKFTGSTTIGNSVIADNTNEINIPKRIFLNSGTESIFFTPNLGGTSNRIEGSSGVPLEITTGGSSLKFAAGGTTPQFTLASSGAATFTGSVTASSIIKSGGTSTQYLMADGSVSTLTNPVTGTGSAGQVAYWSSGSAITGESNLFWDATNDRLGISTNTPAYKLDIQSTIDASFLQLTSTATANNTSLRIGIDGNNSFINASGGSTGILQLRTYGSTKATLTSGGNLLVGTTTDAGYKLDVNGTTIFRGASVVRSAGGYSTGLIIENTNTSANNFSVLTLKANTDGYPIIEFKEGDNQKWQIFNNYSDDSLNFYKWVGTAGTVLTLASTGAATFSGNVFITKATPLLVLNDTSGSGAQIGSFGGNLNLIDNATGTKGVVINLSTGAATFSSSVTAATFLRASSGAQSNPTGGASVAIDYQSTSDLQGRIRSRDWDGAAWKNLTLEANNIILSPAGNVGIGTTSPISGGGDAKWITLDGNSYGGGFISSVSGTAKGYSYYDNGSATFIMQGASGVGVSFWTNNTERMRITSGGNVLIGTTTDTGEKLQVSGNIRTNSGYIQIRNSSNPSLYINNGSAQWQEFVNSSNNLVFSDAIANVLTLAYNSGAATFSSSVTATSFITSSDTRLKDVIERDGDLAVYKRKGEEQIHYGYLAQEMKEIYPNQVHEDQDGFLSLNYVEILVKKVNELEKKIKQLEK